MKTEFVKLHFSNGLHIGKGSEELDKTTITYGSDALMSAIFALGINYYSDWLIQPQEFFEAFKISSAFPFDRDELFFPKPGSMIFKFEKTNDLTEAKKAKKISYVSSELFRKWINDSKGYILVTDNQVGDGSFLFTKPDARKFVFTSVQQRVSISSASDGGDASPYYFEKLLFQEESGLFFLIQFIDENFRERVLHIISLLGDVGIGTDRTVGNGQFVADTPETFELPGNSIMNVQMPLGLYLPTQDELKTIDMDQSNWTLIKRGGYIAASENEKFRSLRKNSIYFFGEGSQFKTDYSLKGRLVDLKPDFNDPDLHPVWRSGMPIFLHL